MKLAKAIEIVADSAWRGVTTFDQDYKDAQKLLIEAGKQVIERRGHDPDFLFEKLPGETQN